VRCVTKFSRAKGAAPLHFSRRGTQSSSLRGVKLRCKPKRKSNFGDGGRLAETFGEGNVAGFWGLAVIRDHRSHATQQLAGQLPIRACGWRSQAKARPPSMAKSAS
jgi:hypothetical protein